MDAVIAQGASLSEAIYLKDTRLLGIITPALEATTAKLGFLVSHDGVTLDTVKSAMTTYCAARKISGWKRVIALTIIPRGDAGNPVDWDANRQAFNTWLLANYATIGADAVADVAADARLQNYNDTTYFNADKVHLTDAGYAVVAGIVASAITAP